MNRFLHRIRRRLVIWWRDSDERQMRLAGYRGGRFAASRLYGGWNNVPGYCKRMLEINRQTRREPFE
jgi:hypothetical protein